jgi:hypothetical protein
MCGLAWTAQGAIDVWQALEPLYLTTSEALAQMIRLPDSVLSESVVPKTLPWQAVVLLPGAYMAINQDDISWMGDFERCFAWAILESGSNSS